MLGLDFEECMGVKIAHRKGKSLPFQLIYTPPVPCTLRKRDKEGQTPIIRKAEAEETSWPVCGSPITFEEKGEETEGNN